MQKITNRQAQVLGELIARGFEDAMLIPEEIWPCRDNYDNAQRRHCRALYEVGVLLKHPDAGRHGYGSNIYQLPENAADIYHEWYTQRGWKLGPSMLLP